MSIGCASTLKHSSPHNSSPYTNVLPVAVYVFLHLAGTWALMFPSLLVLHTSSRRVTWPWTQTRKGAKGGSGPPRPPGTLMKSSRQSSSSRSSGADTQTKTGSRRPGGPTVMTKRGLLLGPLLLLRPLLLRGSVRHLCLLLSWQRGIWRWCRLLRTSGCWSSCGNRWARGWCGWVGVMQGGV